MEMFCLQIADQEGKKAENHCVKQLITSQMVKNHCAKR